MVDPLGYHGSILAGEFKKNSRVEFFIAFKEEMNHDFVHGNGSDCMSCACESDYMKTTVQP